MSRAVGARLLVAALLVCACKVDGSIGRADPIGGGEGGGGAGAMTEATDESSGDGTLGTGDGGGSEEGGTLDQLSAGGDEGDRATEGEVDVPEACIPLPGDNECMACRKTECCELLHTCLSHDPCICWWHCIPGEGDQTCTEQCGTDGALFAEMQACAHAHCEACFDGS